MNDALGSPQSVLCLGGGSEIALATVRKLVGARCRTVVLAGRDPGALTTPAKELRDLGATTVETVAFDALEVASHDAFVADVFSSHGDFDLVLLAFGVLGDQDLAETDGAEARRIVATNFIGAVSVLVPVVQALRKQGHGTIVVLSSVAGERARKSNFVYGSSKAGLDAYCQGLGDSLVGTGVRVMIVRPGFVHTKMTEGMAAAPLSTTPEVVADAIVTGLGRGSEIVWAPAPLRFVMSALRHVPRAMFRRLPV
ncbi:MAG: decaprenylphospho-beta-D-erythro-pentofuranosid-2-ulose 2-reductase [Actinobacteria bacterium]|nr:decaprenylphospho-beta-D-erythro-pentofuranosid-2-ulose 2-reductase [Actinomycetota bacterium]